MAEQEKVDNVDKKMDKEVEKPEEPEEDIKDKQLPQEQSTDQDKVMETQKMLTLSMKNTMKI